MPDPPPLTPEKEGGTTKGATATRALVGNDLEWIEWQGKADADGTDGEEDTEEPSEPGTGGGGYFEEDPLA